MASNIARVCYSNFLKVLGLMLGIDQHLEYLWTHHVMSAILA